MTHDTDAPPALQPVDVTTLSNADLQARIHTARSQRSDAETQPASPTRARLLEMLRTLERDAIREMVAREADPWRYQ